MGRGDRDEGVRIYGDARNRTPGLEVTRAGRVFVGSSLFSEQTKWWGVVVLAGVLAGHIAAGWLW